MIHELRGAADDPARSGDPQPVRLDRRNQRAELAAVRRNCGTGVIVPTWARHELRVVREVEIDAAPQLERSDQVTMAAANEDLRSLARGRGIIDRPLDGGGVGGDAVSSCAVFENIKNRPPAAILGRAAPRREQASEGARGCEPDTDAHCVAAVHPLSPAIAPRAQRRNNSASAVSPSSSHAAPTAREMFSCSATATK